MECNHNEHVFAPVTVFLLKVRANRALFELFCVWVGLVIMPDVCG